MPIASINPFNGETLHTFQALSAGELEQKLKLARQCFEMYRKTPLAERAEKLNRAAVILEN